MDTFNLGRSSQNEIQDNTALEDTQKTHNKWYLK